MAGYSKAGEQDHEVLTEIMLCSKDPGNKLQIEVFNKGEDRHGLLRVSSGSSSPALEPRKPEAGSRKPGQTNTPKGFEPLWSYATSAAGEARAFSESERETGSRARPWSTGDGKWGSVSPGVVRALAGCRTGPPVETCTSPSRLLTSPASPRLPFLHAPGSATPGFSGSWIHPAL
uniref:Uncharacterized protein n=1 Tax=Rangifer tarandus platyrhynchus TaxID=3082113 RepID=A0ACB0FIJ2_RANTA|nr:unnamed protein product [Rangifer tarandus platyrhynchus]